MQWLVLIPPLLVVTGVFLTRRMLPSFMLGILSGALLVTGGNPIKALMLTLQKLWTSSGLSALTSIESFFSSWNLLIFLFLIMIGIIIELLAKTGAAQAYATIASRYVKTKKQAEIASLILSCFFFIDDYFSALTVGSVMRPLALRYQVHPLKLAFLTTALAIPLTILSPVSSWVGEIILQLKQVGIGPESTKTVIAADPYLVLVRTIPFLLYAIILIISTWYIVLRGISYGPMKKYEDSIKSARPPLGSELKTNSASFFDFMLPIVLLISVVFFMLLYTGNFYLFGGNNSFFEAVKNAAVHQALFAGGAVTLLVTTLYFLAKKLLTSKLLKNSFIDGLNLMYPSILMLICAWSLGSLLKNDLQTGSYMAQIVSSFITLELFPVICFLFAALIAWMIGSAWATIGLMFPIVVDMLQKLLHLPINSSLETVPFIIPIIGATLCGCVLGNQLSVMADNPIMSAASTGANHLEHIKTMAWYILPVALATAIAFTFIGFCYSSLGAEKYLLMSLAIGIAVALAFLELGQFLYSRRNDK